MLITCLCRACATCLCDVCIVLCNVCEYNVLYQFGVSVSSVLLLSFVSVHLFTELN